MGKFYLDFVCNGIGIMHYIEQLGRSKLGRQYNYGAKLNQLTVW